MKKTLRVCDICGKDITGADIIYNFKKYENSYVNYEDFEWNKWDKLDMCEDCFKALQEFIKTRKLLFVPIKEINELPNPSDGIPACCRSCPNHTINGGSGICNCSLPYLCTTGSTSSNLVTNN